MPSWNLLTSQKGGKTRQTEKAEERKKERWERGKEKDQREKGEGEEQEEESKAHLKALAVSVQGPWGKHPRWDFSRSWWSFDLYSFSPPRLLRKAIPITGTAQRPANPWITSPVVSCQHP